MTLWRSMIEQLMPFTKETTEIFAKPRLSISENGSLKSISDSLDDLLLPKELYSSEGIVTLNAREEEYSSVISAAERDHEHIANLKSKMQAMLWALQSKDDAIAFLNQKLQQRQTEATLYQEKTSALTSENLNLRKELEASHARQKVLEKNLEQLMRRQSILEDAEERLCAQLADLEVETLEQSHEYKAELSKLTSELQQKEALITSLAVKIESTPAIQKASVSVEINPSLQLAKAKSQLESLHRKHSETSASLHTAESEIIELKRTIDALKAEMLRLDSAKQTQVNLLQKAQKELESLRRRKYPIQIEAAEMLFNLKSASPLLVGA
ncbi:hypothetical protein O6H91_22G046900 [Diphasiastrum complanatum]|uniref:Uncharacterized protein n=2 Tax=Diphasiastrum complanatum TaxID=34168 RepID=A0ACC2AF88_DIPCM|nr:hypothetical protein O6H91_22G046500 [Diphasiastrum complanatum]KAJ7516203.1 hypothetical protein O6H91_22G046900 [Diphasiastrum complanatum]